MTLMRAIIHVDMDAFYASVEQTDHPQLRARPVVVGGDGSRGVVAAASYEARQHGVRSAMPASVARRKCPDAVFVKPRFARYREVSARVFEIFHRYSDRVEGLSLDEAYIDLSDNVEGGAELVETGREIKRVIAAETGLTASVGMAHNKLLAKLASDYDKPDGLVHIPRGQERRFLDPLPVRRLPGVGKRSAERLKDAGILTIGQLRLASPELMQELFGDHGLTLLRLAAGEDDRPVNPVRTRRSISQETTFDKDHHHLDTLLPVIAEQAASVASKLRVRGLHARVVTLKLRSSGFSTITRSESLRDFTTDAEEIAGVASTLLERWASYRQGFAIRLIGVGVSGLDSQR